MLRGPSLKRLFTYSLGGVRFRSSRELLGVPQTDLDAVDIDLKWVGSPLLDETQPTQSLPGGRMVVQVDAAARYRLVDGLEFDVQSEGRVLRIWSPRPASLSLTHVIVDSVIPLFLSTRACIVLHGAGLVVGGGAIGLLGDSGAGKSTLASYWVSKGERFLSDDWFGVRADGRAILVEPSHPSIRLRNRKMPFLDDAAIPRRLWQGEFAKHWYSFEPERATYANESQRLLGLISCRRDETLSQASIRRLSSQEAAMMLLSKVFLLETESPRKWQQVLGLLSQITARIEVSEMAFPSGSGGLEQATAFIREASESQPQETRSAGLGS